MRKIIIFLITCVLGATASAQFTYKIKADSLLVTNDSCSAEFNLENSTKSVKGFLYNKGNGRTEFRRGLINQGDSMYFIGADTLKLKSAISSNAWKLTGNAGTTTATNFIGTTDNQALLFKTNNIGRVTINGFGNVGVGTAVPGQLLHLYGTNPTLFIEGDANSYYGGIKMSNIMGSATIDNYGINALHGTYIIKSTNNNKLTAVGVLLNDGACSVSEDSSKVTHRVVSARNQAADIFRVSRNIASTYGEVTEQPVFVVNKDGNLWSNRSAQFVSPVNGKALFIQPIDLAGGELNSFTGIKVKANLDVQANGPNKLLVLENTNVGSTLYNHNYMMYVSTGRDGFRNYTNIPNAGGLVIGADSVGSGINLPLYVKSAISSGAPSWSGYFYGNGSGAAYLINDSYPGDITDGSYYWKYGLRIKSTGALHNLSTSNGTNIGLLIDAQDADVNYGIYVNTGKNYMADKLGLGTVTPLHQLDVNGTSRFQKAVYYAVNTSVTNGYYTITDNDHYIELPAVTANQVITLPAASSHAGRRLVLKNKNNSGNTWAFSTAVKDKDGSNITNLANNSVYDIISNGTDWNIINFY
jgi:hypothetical protein